MHSTLAQKKHPSAAALRRQTTDAAAPKNARATVQYVSAALDELMRGAMAAAGCKDVAAFRKLPMDEQNAFLAQARGLKAQPHRDGVRLYDPETIRRSPMNREHFDEEEMVKLTADVKERGVLQNGMVRPVKPPVGKIAWELIAGERRWLAARRAKREFPATVHQVDDTGALELQAIENLHREDLNAIDEARKYRQLLDAYEREGASKAEAVERLQAKVGKKQSLIYERLTLLKLPSQVQVLTQRGRLPASHAGLLAKVVDPSAALRLAGKIAKPKSNEEKEEAVLSFRETKRLVDEEIEREKRGVAYQRERERFLKASDIILTDEMNRKVFTNQWTRTPASNSGYLTLDTSCDQDASYRTYKVLIGAQGKHLRPVLGRAGDGRPVIVYPESEVKAAVKAAGKLKKRADSPSPENVAARELKPRRAAFDVAMAAVVKEVEMTLDSAQFWRFLALAVASQWRSDPIRRTKKRRGIEESAKLEPLIARMGVGELRALVTEIMLWNDVPVAYSGGWGETIQGACKLCRVPLPAWED